MKGLGDSAAPAQCDVYMVHQGEEAQSQAFILSERLRDAGLDVVLHCATPAGAGSFKSQMKKADGSGAAFAVIIGEDEIASNQAVVKAMRADVDKAAGEQQQSKVAFENVVGYVVDQIVGGGHDCDDENCNEHGHHHRP
jgi:histidyl-tRNA synthetase